MGCTVAITGKGGVGKTTVAGLVVMRLSARNKGPVLAVDADPNTCLDAVLGVQAAATVGAVREEARAIASGGMTGGVSKQELLGLKIHEALVEADSFDLLAMGRPEGPGCYCYANNVLGQSIRALSDQYPFVVLDNEAGLENVSRRIVTRIDLLVLVTDSSRAGLATLRRLYGLSREMEVDFRSVAVVVNRVRSAGSEVPAADFASEIGAVCAVALPDDPGIAACGEQGRSLWTLPVDNPVAGGVEKMLAAACLEEGERSQ